MTLLRTVARPMLASVFIYSGALALRDPSTLAARVQPVTNLVNKAIPNGSVSAKQLVRGAGLAHIIGGLSLATGRMPRTSALALAATLPATSAVSHQYWNETDPAAKRNQQIHFLKNVALTGGLLLSTLDPEPHKRWIGARAKRRVVEASNTIADQVDSLRS